MLKIMLLVILAAGLIGGAAGAIHLLRVAQRNKKEMASFQAEPLSYTAHLGKVLVIYYSRSGHTQDIAQQIQQYTRADLYRIELETPLPNTPWFYLTLKRQLSTGNYPAIKKPLPDISEYDVVFVGSPIWWYTAATPVLQFLREMDFKNKKVVPFSTQGSNYGAFFEDFAAHAKNAQVLKGESFNNLPAKYDDAVDNKITVWLNALN